MTNAPELSVQPPKVFTMGTVVVISLWGLILALPVIVAMMVVSVLQLGALTLIIPLVAIAGTIFFLPLGFGNLYVASLVRPLRPPAIRDEDVFLVQLTRDPRNRSGLLALFEDADDIGYLILTESALLFHGDSFRLGVPLDKIKELRLQTSGWRALFAYGPRTVFSVAGLEQAGTFAFSERWSWHLPGSRRNARRMYRRLAEAVPSTGAPTGPKPSR